VKGGVNLIKKMKRKTSILFIIDAFTCFVGSSFNTVSAVETIPCGNALKEYKKAWFSTNCHQKAGKTCLIRCQGPDVTIKK
jgi:hypothetical protein